MCQQFTYVMLILVTWLSDDTDEDKILLEVSTANCRNKMKDESNFTEWCLVGGYFLRAPTHKQTH
jgi:hypothetical protein